jgi:UDPglucose--hexose-1-phosphate uridylyltransferase
MTFPRRPEVRQDPVSQRWTIIAPERGSRPGAVVRAIPPALVERDDCPFCAGRETMTPPEVYARRPPGSQPNRPDWRVRAIPNRFPAVRPDVVPGHDEIDGFTHVAGSGWHELILESPEHVVSLTDVSAEQAAEAGLAYRDRFRFVRHDGRSAVALLFKNVGAAAGASVEHTHAQLIALPLVPTFLAEELRSTAAYRTRQGSCLFCDLIERETAGGRLVDQTERFAAFVPYAARVPYEVWVVPLRHAAHFDSCDDDESLALGQFLRSVLMRIERVAHRPAYNLVWHTAPFDTASDGAYHWHIEMVPRTTTQAGFEWGTGFAINPLPPEEAADRLRSAWEESP